jgi:hypothetical protein
MISTKNLISSIKQVPTNWGFEYYLKLNEKLTGQDIKIKSIFNTREKTPSMCIYMDKNNNYRFKDFSSGNGGDIISLVQNIFNLSSRSIAFYKVVEDYNQYILNNDYNPIQDYKTHSRYKVTDFEIRHWNNIDQKYWTDYHIGSKILEKYNVHPLSHYILTKFDDEGVESSITIKGNYIYGYFKNDGTLYKIYQPKVKDSKFIKVKDYTQGLEQLTYKSDYLLITSSLKDLMCFTKLKIFNIESIAPDSENTMINENIINNLVTKYKKICLLFDNDEPGLKSAQKYKNKYGFNYINLNMSKDLSDSIKDSGVDIVKNKLFSLLKESL